MTITDVLNQALESEQRGVPVNWRELCIRMHNAAVEVGRERDELRSERDDLRREAEERDDLRGEAGGDDE